jgi:Phosphotransferase enzyme family
MRTFLTRDDLTGIARVAFPARALREVTRLTGGSVKGVYRLRFDDGFTCLAYRWHADENFWPAQTFFDVGPFVGHGSRETFVERHAVLTGLGVRVPEIFEIDETADLALVEDVRGGTLQALLERDAAAGREVLARLGETLRTMHTHTSAGFGFPGRTVQDFILERGRRSLVEAAARVPRIAAVQDRLAYALSTRFATITARSVHGLIHGELGPDHVMVDDAGAPVLIDIEGTMFFDVEWEHAFLELRFGPLYPALGTVPLDPARMRLYRLTEYLSLVAGPLLLIEGDFPNADGMRQIAEWNIPRVLAELD